MTKLAGIVGLWDEHLRNVRYDFRSEKTRRRRTSISPCTPWPARSKGFAPYRASIRPEYGAGRLHAQLPEVVEKEEVRQTSWP